MQTSRQPGMPFYSSSVPESIRRAPPTPSLLLRLPLRLWIRILLLLDYKTLMNVRRVCKRLKTALKASAFDLLLFRLPPPLPLRKIRTYQLHPMLQAVDCATVTHDKARIRTSGGGYLNGYRYPASNEFASSPACVRMVVYLNEARVGIIENERGVTVKEVLLACSRYWRKPVSSNLAAKTRREQCLPQRGKRSHVTKIVTLGKYCKFEGWKEPSGMSDGTVFLASHWFGSWGD